MADHRNVAVNDELAGSGGIHCCSVFVYSFLATIYYYIGSLSEKSVMKWSHPNSNQRARNKGVL